MAAEVGPGAETHDGTEVVNVAAVLHGVHDLRVEEYPMPDAPGPEDVIVSMQRVGICMSDVHYWQRGSIGPFVLKDPMVIGHESAGIVSQVGDSVTHLKVGDRVAIEPGVPCWKCPSCSGGLYNLCPEMKFFATPPVHGSLARYICHPARLCFKLPDEVSLEEGAMCEPLSVAVHACRRSGVRGGDHVLVLGAGPIGLLCCMTAKAFGATTVSVTDIAEDRLAVAKALGADNTVSVLGISPKEAAERVLASAPGNKAADVTIDCAGFTPAFQTGLLATRGNGHFCMVGLGQDNVDLPLAEATVREINMHGVFRYRDTYPTCIDLMRAGLVNVRPLITHRHSFTEREVLAGFSRAHEGTDGCIKVMFNLSGEEDEGDVAPTSSDV